MKMGYQPGLDGLRALSVIAVILYHAGFGWMGGGFFGVEVFFVVSGYLITSLLLDEREGSGRISLGQFWLRRARRLLPALFTMLFAVAIWARFAGSAEQVSTLRRDLPWSIFYLGNWGQILGKTAYFSTGDPPLLRHLWSLAVEEQWYLMWPLVFVAAWMFGGRRLAPRGLFFVLLAVAMMALTFWLHSNSGDPNTISVLGNQADRTNFMYLGTFTRSSGLLLGAGCAFLWRPWRNGLTVATPGRLLDPIGAAAVAGLGCIMAVANLTEGYVYQWLLALVSLLSMIAIAVVVHPDAEGFRAIMSWPPLVEVGKRSYGLYLWHWPIFVIGKIYHTGDWLRFVVGMAATVVISEICYRFIETPIRHGVIGQWVSAMRHDQGERRAVRQRLSVAMATTMLGVSGLLVSFYAGVEQFDPAAGGEEVQFSLPAQSTTTTTVALQDTATVASELPGVTTTSSAPATTTTLAELPRTLAIIGDSQAHSLAINMPDGIEETFTIEDGSFEGCGVHVEGNVISERQGFRRSFSDCLGFEDKWERSATRSNADVALVVLGAWDVFDIETEAGVIGFDTATGDAVFLDQLQLGIDAIKRAGTHVALLEIPCMRPKDVDGAGVPALPERGDDARVEHLNDLLREAAAGDPDHVTFVVGPAQWCGDEAISTDLGYRWDGIHYYQQGVNLVMETIAETLLRIPVSS